MFTTPSLQKSYEHSKNIIDNIANNLDKVTSEINSLQKYLKNSNLLDNFEYMLQPRVETRTLQQTNEGSEKIQVRTSFIIAKGLRWDNSLKKIIYTQREYNLGQEVDMHNYNCNNYVANKLNELNSVGGWDYSCSNNDKPLLETSFHIRKQMLSCLGDFLAKLAEEYNIPGVDINHPNG